MFIDEASLLVKGGDGGHGCVSFRREKYVPRGGPDGGDGGDGGSVSLLADPAIDTLYELTFRHQFAAGSGRPGQGKNKTGASGEDLVVRVPVGTLVFDAATGLLLRDLDKPGESVCVATGGRGGRGNKHFSSPTNRAPRQAEQGQAGQERKLRLELKLLADVGLVGLPNAGKSTLITRVSNARPKIANYPFTTRYPCLGIADVGGYRRLVVADIPGLIEGAHDGHGLGIEFLRHIERTRVILHVLDAAGVDGTPPIEAYHVLRKELSLYPCAAAADSGLKSEIRNPKSAIASLAERPHIVAANKIDLPEGRATLDELRSALPVEVIPISAATGEGLPALLAALSRMVDALPAKELG
ncbi:MAG: GTPase ObgE [Planctomycetes bacterium]|nr:GTPase ObgE [Planctomycetota bacterium]